MTDTKLPEGVKEIPLLYPLVSITLRTVAIVDGRRIDNGCEEILNLEDTENNLPIDIHQLVHQFKDYVQKVIASASSQQGRDALRHILDNQPPDRSPHLVNPPSSPASEEDSTQGTLPLDSPVPWPLDKASLKICTPSVGTMQLE